MRRLEMLLGARRMMPLSNLVGSGSRTVLCTGSRGVDFSPNFYRFLPVYVRATAHFESVGQRRPLGDLLASLETNSDALRQLLNQKLAIQRLIGDDQATGLSTTYARARQKAEGLFAIGEGQEVILLPQHLASALLRVGTSTAAATSGEQDTTRLLGYTAVPSPSSCFNGAITSPSAA